MRPAIRAIAGQARTGEKTVFARCVHPNLAQDADRVSRCSCESKESKPRHAWGSWYNKCVCINGKTDAEWFEAIEAGECARARWCDASTRSGVSPETSGLGQACASQIQTRGSLNRNWPAACFCQVHNKTLRKQQTNMSLHLWFLHHIATRDQATATYNPFRLTNQPHWPTNQHPHLTQNKY